MKHRWMCALSIALAVPAFAQTEPQLEPLVPQKQPAPNAPAKPEGELPPLAPLTPPQAVRAGASVGILVVGALPEPAATRVADGLRAALDRAPSVRTAVTVQTPQPCTSDACQVMAGTAANVDRVLVASLSNRTLRIRILDVVTRKQVAQGHREGVSSEPAEASAWAEAIACKLLVPGGCTGEVRVDAPAGIGLELDGRPLPAGERRTLPVGVHTLRVKEGASVSSRPVPVLIEGTPPISIGSAAPPAVAIAPPAAAAPPPSSAGSAAPAAALTSTAPPEPRRTWPRTAGYVAAGAAVAAAAVGVYFGAKSRSDLDQAESSYRANGAYQPADLDALHSGNSAAHTANALFIASGILLATGAVLTFAF